MGLPDGPWAPRIMIALFFGFGIFIHIFHTFNKYILGGRVMAVSKDKALTLMGIVFE